MTGTAGARSAVDEVHDRLLMAFAGGRREIVQPFDLLGAQLDAVSGYVLLDAGDPLRAGDRGDVVALREQPGQSHLCGCCTRLGGDSFDFVDDAQVALEVLAGKARVGLAPVVVGELLGRADLAGEEAVAERRVRNDRLFGAPPQRDMKRMRLI
jgi:hypothetical protein